MRTLEEYMRLPYRMELVPDPDEGGAAVFFPELPGCVTSGKTIEAACRNAEDAKQAWFSAAMEEGMDIPLPESLENYSGQFKLRLPRSLHRELARQAKREGVSMNQYCVYRLSSGLSERRTGPYPRREKDETGASGKVREA